MNNKPRIGIITSGGDCPGLNTVIHSVVTGLEDKYEILGFIKGYEGLLNNDSRILTSDITREYEFDGGTFLKTVNKGRFAVKVGTGQLSPLEEDIVASTIKNYHDLNLECIVSLGGDGSMVIANELGKNGLNIIGIPKSMDNDLCGTDYTFGFYTAVENATDAIGKLRTVAYSHDRAMVLEVMGRHAGWVALYAGLSGGADIILIPEIPFSFDVVLKTLEKNIKKGKTDSVIVVSEGAFLAGGEKQYKSSLQSRSESILGGIGEIVAETINQSGISESRLTTLGHTIRGGTPGAFDRILCKSLGSIAVGMVLNKEYGKMARIINNEFGSISITECSRNIKVVPLDSPLIGVARNQGISFGDE